MNCVSLAPDRCANLLSPSYQTPPRYVLGGFVCGTDRSSSLQISSGEDYKRAAAKAVPGEGSSQSRSEMDGLPPREIALKIELHSSCRNRRLSSCNPSLGSTLRPSIQLWLRLPCCLRF